MKAIKCSFKDLFCSNLELNESKIIISNLEIPRIQRDYAQGRMEDDVNRIRERFLNALLNAIINNREIILDFTYGVISHIDTETKKGQLTLLDGQQRLTTLFLLHWYIAKKEGIKKEDHEFLSCFSYDTRFSSRDFCEKLIEFTPEFSNARISNNIIDQIWYSYDWNNDPTIQSMLVMIDAIHEKLNKNNNLKNNENLWESLVINKNINFYFLPIKEMGDPEELYIKMNSRGKSLTLFEHFKAEFEKNIIHFYSEEEAHKIFKKFDLLWTDMLFSYYNKKKTIDDEFMRYFQFISDILLFQAENYTNPEKDAFRLTDKLYSKECVDAKENINYFIKSFDCWCKPNIADINEFFDKYFYDIDYKKDKVKLFKSKVNPLKECFDNQKFPLTRYLLLFSINTYIQNKNCVSENDFIKRIRIIRNLIENSTNEIRNKQMKTLLKESKEIILNGNILEDETGLPGYNDFQKNEERQKIDYLEKNPNIKEDLYQLEDNELLKGCISIVGLDNSDNFKKFTLLFNECNMRLIDRAMLSLGDCTQERNDRFYTGLNNNWDEYFHHSGKIEGFNRTSVVLNKLLRTFNENENITDKLKEVIDVYLNNENTLKDWRYYFVKYHEILNQSDINGNYADGNYLKRDNEAGYNIIKLNKYKLSGYNWNVYLYILQKANPDNLKLGNYYVNYNDKLRYKDFLIDCFVDKFVVYQGEETIEYIIQQENGIDTEDRIEKGKKIIMELG